MTSTTGLLTIRDLAPAEADALGQLMVKVYAGLEGFPTPQQELPVSGFRLDLRIGQ